MAEIDPKTVFWTNNLFIFDNVPLVNDNVSSNLDKRTNLFIETATATSSHGLVNIGGHTAEDFSLTAESPAIDTGTDVPEIRLDYLHHTIPDSSGFSDIGAFEYNSSRASCLPPRRP